MKGLRYLWQAFVARPWGMPIPPNWFVLAAAGLLGHFISPGFWLLGAGIELAYLLLLASNHRFQLWVDSGGAADSSDSGRHYQQLFDSLDDDGQRSQQAVEQRAREILGYLRAKPVLASHISTVEQLVWLNLRLLVAGRGLKQLAEHAEQERDPLRAKELLLQRSLADPELNPELRRSLEQQQAVIDARQHAHSEASRRYQHVEAEIERIDQQLALIGEQALLMTDESGIGQALDALTSAFDETSRWLGSNSELLGALAPLTEQPLPPAVLATSNRRARTKQQQ